MTREKRVTASTLKADRSIRFDVIKSSFQNISGLCREVDEHCALLRSIGPTFNGQDSWPLNIGPIGCPETSARNYHYWLRNILGELFSFHSKKLSYESEFQILSSSRDGAVVIVIRLRGGGSRGPGFYSLLGVTILFNTALGPAVRPTRWVPKLPTGGV
jgi:hypothetical protein